MAKSCMHYNIIRKEIKTMATWKTEANDIMKDMNIPLIKRNMILHHADTFFPEASDISKFNRACRMARELL